MHVVTNFLDDVGPHPLLKNACQLVLQTPELLREITQAVSHRTSLHHRTFTLSKIARTSRIFCNAAIPIIWVAINEAQYKHLMLMVSWYSTCLALLTHFL